jgi:F-type H+-transporting ATPase subunit delta
MAGSVARRYARALVEILPPETLEAAGAALGRMAGLFREMPDLRRTFDDPGVPMPAKRRVLAQIAERLGLDDLLRRFLGLLLERKRMGEMALIHRNFDDLVDARLGRARATVTTAVPLAEADRERLRDGLARFTGKAVLLEPRVDPAIVGGVLAQIGGTIYDGSLRTQLRRLREQLLRG